MKSGTVEPAAAIDGIELKLGVGLFIAGGAFWSGARAKLASVAILEADMLLAGDAGCAVVVNGDRGGLDPAASLFCDVCSRGAAGCAVAWAGMECAVVGVAWGVEVAEFALAAEIGVGVCLAPVVTGGGHMVPSSPGAKVRAEQKPSDEDMSNVWPSLDHVRSVKVA